jgi:phosphatidate cytidylyltransferase
MTGWSAPAELVPVFGRVAAVLVFSTLMVCVVSVLRHFSRRRNDGKEKAASTLWPRAGVWAVIALVLLAADAAGPIGLALLLAGIAVVASGEVCRVVAAAGLTVPPTPTRILAAITILAAGIGGGATLIAVLLVMLPAYFFALIVTPRKGGAARAYGGTGILLYLALPLALLVLLRLRPDGFTVVAWIFLVVCFNDVMAMFAGLLIGRTPLAPTISPSKTVEGTAIGLVGALGAAALMRFAFSAEPAPVYYAASLAIALAGCCGDLAASALKRAAGAKDFGLCLPGHGGVMDRLDSLLFAAPVGFIAVHLFMHAA